MFFLPCLKVNAILSALADHWHKLNMAYPLLVCPNMRLLSWTTSKGRPTEIFFIKKFYLRVAYLMIHNQMSHNQAKNWVLSLIYRAAIDFKKSKKK